MKNHLKLIVLFGVFLASISLPAQSDLPSFNWDSYMEHAVSIRGLQFSPDGAHLLFTTRKANWDSNQWNSEHYVLDIAANTNVKLDFDQQGVRAVTWSPSGKYLSFLATEKGYTQLFIETYPERKLIKTSAHPTGITHYRWSPDETKVAYLAQDPKMEALSPEPFVKAFEVGPHGYLEQGASPSTHLHLWDLEMQKMTRLTEGSWTISSDLSWSADGESVSFTKKLSAYPSNWNRNKVMLFELSTNTLSALSVQLGFEFAPQFAPKGNGMIYYSALDKNPAGMRDLLFHLGETRPVNITEALDRNFKSFFWLPKGKGVIAFGQQGTLDGVWKITLDGEVQETPFSNSYVISNLVVNKKGKIAMVASTGNQPPEIFYVESLKDKPQKLSSFNETFKNMALGKVESINWETDNNMTADGVVTYPPDFSEEKRYPLVLFIHGGPTASSSESFNPMAQRMAGKGWIVLQPNYRGSNNRGDAFQEAIMNDGGEGPGKDVMAGVQQLVAKGFIDESKIGVSGWSYGGFMTSWLLGRYPTIWKVAVAGAPPVDYTDMTSLTRMNLTLRHAITNSPWVGDNYELHFDMSPMKNLAKIQTPTLIMSKVEDQIVSVTGSYKLYHALLANHIPTKFIAYPGGGHFPSDPLNQKDVYDRWVGWLEHYLNQ